MNYGGSGEGSRTGKGFPSTFVVVCVIFFFVFFFFISSSF